MEKTEPTLVPEWLKRSGGLSASHHFTSSLHSDEQGTSKSLRNKSLDNNLGRLFISDRTTPYFRRTSISNGSANLRSYSSFNRNHRDRDHDNNIFKFRNKEKSENSHVDCSDSLGNILPSRFAKDGLRRSRSSISGKRGESMPRNVANDLTTVNKSSHRIAKTSFERDFPSLGFDEKQVDSDIGRVSSIQSLPVGNSTMICADGWTSALAEVPAVDSNNNNGNGCGVQLVQPVSSSAPTSLTAGRNMAETLARGPPRTQTAPQLNVETQRLEELAVKQSRQLIPLTPTPKTLACDKPKLKIGQSQLVNNLHTPQSATVKPDVSKTSTVGTGKLLVLKPSRERNGISPTLKESFSPTSGSKLLNSPDAVPFVAASTPLSKPGVVVLEKRPSLLAQSRINFFNNMRKKSMNSSNSTSVAPDSGEPEVVVAPAPQSGSGSAMIQRFSETKVDLTCSGSAGNNGKNLSGHDVILYSEEEEARFLRSLGWEETAEDEEGLTEEEITSFYKNYLNLKPASKILNGTQLKPLMPLGEISSNSKLNS